MPLDFTKYITASPLLKICTILAHGFIFCGGMHGFFPLLFIEVFGGLIFGNTFAPIYFSMLFGQIFLIVSIFLKSPSIKIKFHIAGLIFLWAAILYFALYAWHHPDFMLPVVTLLPFAICTIITIAAKPAKRLFARFLAK